MTLVEWIKNTDCDFVLLYTAVLIDCVGAIVFFGWLVSLR